MSFQGKKQIYVDPQYLPTEYEEEEIDYALAEEDSSNMTLDDIGIPNYDDVEAQLNRKDMTPKQKRCYLNKIVKDAVYKRHQLKGYKTQVTKAYNKGEINDAERSLRDKQIKNAQIVINQHINKYKLIIIQGSGQKTKRGGSVIYFNDPKQLFKKLEIIIGELMAGNTPIKMRDMGVSILDILLKTSATIQNTF